MGARQRRQRNRRTSKVRSQIERCGVRSDRERSSLGLVIEADLALEALITTASESVQWAPSELQRDEKQLTAALKDAERIERVWRLVAHAIAARAAAAASHDGEWALNRLRAHHPLPDQVREDLETALDSFSLGLGDVDTNLARLVFAELIEENAMAELALFSEDGSGGVLTDRLLAIAWDQSEDAFLRQARWLRSQE